MGAVVISNEYETTIEFGLPSAIYDCQVRVIRSQPQSNTKLLPLVSIIMIDDKTTVSRRSASMNAQTERRSSMHWIQE